MKLFPVALLPNGDKTEKKPLVKWKEEATDNEDRLNDWAQQWPGCAWGTPTGEEAGYWVLDADVQHNGLANVQGLPGWPWDTFTVETPSGGRHWYFQWPSGGVRQTQGLVPGVDTRANGGFVVTANGDVGYTVEKDLPIAPTPPALALFVRPKAPPLAAPGNAPSGGAQMPGAQVKGKLNRRTLAFVAEGAPPGQWHKEYFQAAMNMKQEGYDQAEAEALLVKATGVLDDTDRKQLHDVYANRVAMGSDAPQVVEWRGLLEESVSFISDPRRARGEPTGLGDLDHLLGGGKRPGELTVTVAEAKTGKNSVWHWLMHEWLERGHGLAYASQELSPMSEVLPNLLSIKLKRNVYKQPFSKEEALACTKQWKLVFTPDTGPIGGDELIAWMDACRTMGINYFFIDHYHFLLEDPEDFKEGSKFIRRLKRYARTYEVHIDLIVQPKVLQAGERLSLNSARGGAAIGQALDNLILMERERDQTGKRLNVVKVRLELARSKLAESGHFYLAYDKELMTFQPVDVETVPDQPMPLMYGKVLG